MVKEKYDNELVFLYLIYLMYVYIILFIGILIIIIVVLNILVIFYWRKMCFNINFIYCLYIKKRKIEFDCERMFIYIIN